MIKSEKKLRDLALILEKDNPALVAGAVEMLRNEEPLEGAVSLLASCYEKNNAPVVRRSVENFFNDLKDSQLRPEIIGEIKKDRSTAARTMLISACWQSGMDYSDHVMEFVRIFLDGEYSIALECFTVIEGAVPELKKAEKEKIKELVGENRSSAGSKESLYLELLSVLGS